MFDLRSDTVTRPSPGMRAAIAVADVGDDVYREDPTTRLLEEEVAAITGKPAALFVSSGTMANQLALLCQTRPGDEVIAGRSAHVIAYESGAGAALSGVQFAQTAGEIFSAEEAARLIRQRAYYCPRTSVIAVENTHNMGGGRIFPQTNIAALGELCRREGFVFHLDGARIWNAAIATGTSVAELCAPFDSVSVCFSKGLGAPVGSALCGSRELLERALRWRKMLGGGMRQVGLLAAGARYALEHNRTRLAEDHAAAAALGARLAEIEGVTVAPVETNIVIAKLAHAEAAVARGRALGASFSAISPDTIRLVTHLDVTGPRFGDALALVTQAVREALHG
ncbi:MAG: aminotransferase class I/II-fold pyridoxal phosphate-dependent enzyme [Myxococcales bacterium]|nr:aminotransferase class I/II-fold pyridoxal phosphate-dependent enzyme [Myxococcales bacterium]